MSKTTEEKLPYDLRMKIRDNTSSGIQEVKIIEAVEDFAEALERELSLLREENKRLKNNQKPSGV